MLLYILEQLQKGEAQDQNFSELEKVQADLKTVQNNTLNNKTNKKKG